MTIQVLDETPRTFVMLETRGAAYTAQQYGSQVDDNIWEWVWTIETERPFEQFTVYHNCSSGCEKWVSINTGKVEINDASEPVSTKPTKLGLVFANESRDWHGKQGWDVEITYATLAEEEFWGIDDLAQRVRRSHELGLQVLVRVEYAQGQNVPPPDDYVALDAYLRYVERIVRDDRLSDVHGLIIGSNFNTYGSNSQSPDNPVTPEWYARVFNGYGANPTVSNSVLESVRAIDPNMRVIVGPVSPWNVDQNGSLEAFVDAPWLNYMHTTLTYLDQSAQLKASIGRANLAPDGFAVQAFGRVTHESLTTEERANEPKMTLHFEEWGEAQMGFRVFEDWLTLINQFATTQGKPVYINASNTFDGLTGSVPADNYPVGWLTTALEEVEKVPQIYALCWFMDGFSHDEQWIMFSLITARGLLIEAAQEFDQLLAAD